MEQIIIVTCASCSEEIKSINLNLTGVNEFHVDLSLDYESFYCNHCGETTGISLVKEII